MGGGNRTNDCSKQNIYSASERETYLFNLINNNPKCVVRSSFTPIRIDTLTTSGGGATSSIQPPFCSVTVRTRESLEMFIKL